MQPSFIVIAGPNGAGKSTTSKDILEPHKIEAFDWDQEFNKPELCNRNRHEGIKCKERGTYVDEA